MYVSCTCHVMCAPETNDKERLIVRLLCLLSSFYFVGYATALRVQYSVSPRDASNGIVMFAMTNPGFSLMIKIHALTAACSNPNTTPMVYSIVKYVKFLMSCVFQQLRLATVDTRNGRLILPMAGVGEKKQIVRPSSRCGGRCG